MPPDVDSDLMQTETKQVVRATIELVDQLLALFTDYGIDVDEPTESGRSFREMGIEVVLSCLERRVKKHYEQQRRAVEQRAEHHAA